MKLLITGGAGYIGSVTAHLLSELGHEIVVVDNLNSGRRASVPATAQFHEANVGDKLLLESLHRSKPFDAIFHFAAHIEVEESVSNPAKYYENNVTEAFRLFDFAQKARIRSVIFSSTAAVYGESKTKLIDEDGDLAPINPYGASKLMSERILRDLASASNGITNCVVLRYFNAAGARRDLLVGQARPRATHLVNIAAEAVLGLRDSVGIYGTDYATPDGTCQRDYIHVEDLARAHWDALTYLSSGGKSDVFNVGYGRLYSVREVLQTMQRVSKVNFKIVEGPRRPGDPAVLGAKSEKIRKILNWQPRFEDLDLICKTAFEWERKLRSERG